MKWRKDGDQYVAVGSRAEYRITEWTMRGVRTYLLTKTKDASRSSCGDYDSPTDAKRAALTIDTGPQ